MTRPANRTCGPTEPTCVLCFYPARPWLLHPVPLASPPQENVICLDCADEIAALRTGQKRETDEGVGALMAVPGMSASAGTDALLRFWVSWATARREDPSPVLWSYWLALAPEPLPFTVYAVIDAASEDAAWDQVRAGYPDYQPRFIEPKASDWTPPEERFP